MAVSLQPQLLSDASVKRRHGNFHFELVVAWSPLSSHFQLDQFPAFLCASFVPFLFSFGLFPCSLMAFPPKTPLHAPTVSTTLQHYLEVSPLGLSLISFLPFPCYNDAHPAGSNAFIHLKKASGFVFCPVYLYRHPQGLKISCSAGERSYG